MAQPAIAAERVDHDGESRRNGVAAILEDDRHLLLGEPHSLAKLTEHFERCLVQQVQIDVCRLEIGLRQDPVDELRDSGAPLGEELSMGMSQDFELALEAGATILRIGSAFFEGIA